VCYGGLKPTTLEAPCVHRSIKLQHDLDLKCLKQYKSSCFVCFKENIYCEGTRTRELLASFNQLNYHTILFGQFRFTLK
jgi:hypothetical protein